MLFLPRVNTNRGDSSIYTEIFLVDTGVTELVFTSPIMKILLIIFLVDALLLKAV